MKVTYTSVVEKEITENDVNRMAGETFSQLQNILFKHRLCVNRWQANVLLKALFDKPSEELENVIANEVRKKLTSGEVQFDKTADE